MRNDTKKWTQQTNRCHVFEIVFSSSSYRDYCFISRLTAFGMHWNSLKSSVFETLIGAFFVYYHLTWNPKQFSFFLHSKLNGCDYESKSFLLFAFGHRSPFMNVFMCTNFKFKYLRKEFQLQTITANPKFQQIKSESFFVVSWSFFACKTIDRIVVCINFVHIFRTIYFPVFLFFIWATKQQLAFIQRT